MKRIRRKSIELLLLITLLCVPQYVSCSAGEGDDLLLNELCSPVYEGRRVATEGNRLAAQLLAERLETYALTPLGGYSDFLIPFEQSIAVIDETTLAAIMEEGSREELVYGKDYIIGTTSTINGTFPVSLQAEKSDPSAVLFIDPEAVINLPPADAFATMVYPVDTLPFNSLGIVEAGVFYHPNARLPRISMLRPAYDRISVAKALDIRYNFSKSVVTLSNVVGVLPGKDRTRAVILSAHFDGAGDQAGNRLPCALDNASGVAAVDLVLSQMAGTEPPYDVIVAFTNAEESGLTGAYDLSRKLASQYEALYNINVDCVGIKGLPFPMQGSGSSSGSDALYAKMEAYLSRSGFISVPESYGLSDHFPFEEVGIPAIVLGTTDGVIHTANDTEERIDLGVIRGIAEMIVNFVEENPYIHDELKDELEEDHAAEASLADVPTLAYNEAIVQNDTLYMGSSRWMTYTEALRYHPSLPLPQVYRGCPIEACIVELSSFSLLDSDPGQIITLPDDPQNVIRLIAHYSDGVTSYRFDFYAVNVRGPFVKKMIGEEGFIFTMQESDADIIEGIGLQQGDMSLRLLDSDAGELFEIEAGLSIHLGIDGTSKVTEENASALLTDPELTELFEALSIFVQQ